MSSFWSRFTASISSAQKTIEDTKEAYYAKQRAGWLAEVVDPERERFLHFDSWQARYEPKAVADAKGEAEPPSALQVKMLEYMSDQIRDNILHILLSMVSKLLGPAEAGMDGVDENLGAFLNASNGVVLSFRFEYLDDGKFRYLRTYAAGQVAVALARAVEKENQRLGGAAGEEMNPERVAEVTSAVADRIVAEIKSKEQEAHRALEESPVLAEASALDGRADEGVQQLKAFLRGYVQDKTESMIDVIRGVVERVLARVAASTTVIQRHAQARLLAQAEAKAAAAAGGGADGDSGADGAAGSVPRSATTQSLIAGPEGPDPLDAEPEFVKVRQEIVEEVEDAYAKLSASVRHYVQGLVFMLSGVRPADQERALEMAADEKAGQQQQQQQQQPPHSGGAE